jgi:hypothetical protein
MVISMSIRGRGAIRRELSSSCSSRKKMIQTGSRMAMTRVQVQKGGQKGETVKRRGMRRGRGGSGRTLS